MCGICITKRALYTPKPLVDWRGLTTFARRNKACIFCKLIEVILSWICHFSKIFWNSDYCQRNPLKSNAIWRSFLSVKFPPTILSPHNSTRREPWASSIVYRLSSVVYRLSSIVHRLTIHQMSWLIRCLLPIRMSWLVQVMICSKVPRHRNHQNGPASVFLSTHWWSQHLACQPWLFLVVSCFYKPLRNCHPSQRVSKVQRKKVKKKYFCIEILCWIC